MLTRCGTRRLLLLVQVLVCRAQLEEAVTQERWADAARLRDELLQLEPPPPPPPRVATTSRCTTHDVTVAVTSRWVRTDESRANAVFLFSYEITVTNGGQTPVQLLTRHWVITDGTGRVEHVRGPGVVGQQPVLAPGASFSYSSFCPLSTRTGTMHGEFGFVQLTQAPGSATPQQGRPFEVQVQRFGLAVDGTDVPMPPAQEEQERARD